MKLAYDPGDGDAFWDAVEQIAGYPEGVHRPIGQMIFESDAIFRTPDVLRRAGADPGAPLLVVMDPTPMRRGPDDLKRLALDLLRRAGWEVEAVVMEPDASGQVHTDMPHIERVRAGLRPGVSVLAVGSGVICDISKHACHLFELAGGPHTPFVMMQTANSVSAFTSNMAPVFIDGVKRTLDSRYVDALICDLETLADAPKEMTAAGVGDLLAAFVSLPDWTLANRLGMDASANPLPETLMGPLGDLFMAEAEGIRAGSAEGMAVLAKLIALGGLAMSLTHATTSMSGYEHVMSHALDLLAETSDRPLAMHGTQVALTSILGAEVYRRFLSEFEPGKVEIEKCYPAAEEMEARVRAAFEAVDPTGRAGEECWSDYRVKLEAWHARRGELEDFLAHWEAIKPEIARLGAPPERLAEILRAVGAPVHFADLMPPADEAMARFAFMNAPLMRKRLTIGDLLIFLGWDRDTLWGDVWATTQTI